MRIIKYFCLLLVIQMFLFSSCVNRSEPLIDLPDSLEEAKEKMEKFNYDVTIVEGSIADATFAAMGLENVEGAIMAYSEDGEEYVAAYYFESKEDAKNATEILEELMAEEDEEVEEVEVKQSGKWLYVGTKQAFDDFTSK